MADRISNARRVYRTFNDEGTKYRKLVFELRKGELQYFTFVMEIVKNE
ncbi:UDP-N-acetylmuramate--alanine ligase [Leuconostoc litchii]|uniref:UDP-N-acetylmuramate--alanine ligase n=1 Tax=Leuconostoc litchii TaxID=1981069 RepID=A0A6P2CSL4_9LACO|nr:UDP-N-acetylmuramate--alanine ligase [Leuconostoc litchii]TYC47229.1 UDP-N-acetylmuramate--alanine ligase [Leuconostoc litchii]